MQTTTHTDSVRTGAMERGPSSGSRKRIETVVETLAALRSRGESLSEVAHDARNMVTALGLYCDLLEEPGVLAVPFMHYGTELRLVASASRRLVEKLVALDCNLNRAGAGQTPAAASSNAKPWSAAAGAVAGLVAGKTGSSKPKPDWDRQEDSDRNRRWDLLPAVPVANLAVDLLANRNLLSALAGPSVALTMETHGGAQPVHLTGEDLTRILVNLVKNAAEAMPAGGRIHIGLGEQPAAKGIATCLMLTIDDNGRGIPPEALETIFGSGYTTHDQGRGNGKRGKSQPEDNQWPLRHRGLGLAITRSIVEGAGGRIAAANRPQGGARFEIELPVRQASC